MFRSTVLLAALVACALATDTTRSVKFDTKQKCKTVINRADKTGGLTDQQIEEMFGDAYDETSNDLCMSWAEYNTNVCDGNCEKAVKISDEYVNGLCCPTFTCRPVEDDPCCGVDCQVNSLEEADDACNVIHENNQIWNSLSPYYGAMVAKLVDVKDERRGKCCDKYECETNNALFCQKEIERTPCPTQATCPKCYQAQITEPTDVSKGKCCPSIVCVRDDQCMCNERENKECPLPECGEFEYPVVLSTATADACCPVWTCQRRLDEICAAKQQDSEWTVYTGNGMDTEVVQGFDDTIPERACGPCAYVTKYKPANFAAGRCFPTWKCAASENKCCEQETLNDDIGITDIDGNSCDQYDPICDGDCQVSVLQKPMNVRRGKCCDTYTCAVDQECKCSSVPCPYPSAEAYKAFFCPDRPGDNVKQFYEVLTIDAVPEVGKCCPSYSCRETAALKVKKIRLAKRKAKKAAKKAAKASTTATPTTRA